MTARRPLDPDLARILATIGANDGFAEPHQLLESHDLSDIMTAFSGGLIHCVTRSKDGHQGFALAPKGEQAMQGKAPRADAEIEAIRRDMQQMLTALQEVARKVARFDKLFARTTEEIVIEDRAPFDMASAIAAARGLKC